MFDMFFAMFRRKSLPSTVVVRRSARQYQIGDDGELIEVFDDYGGEPLMSQAEAESFVDDLVFDRVALGPMPFVKYGDERLYSKDEIIRWLEGDRDEDITFDGEQITRV